MEKPRKKELLDRTQTIIHGIRAFASYGIGARIYGDGVDDIHLQRAITAAKEIEAMSTWIEGAVPTANDIFLELLNKRKLNCKEVTSDECSELQYYAESIHALLTQRLGGK